MFLCPKCELPLGELQLGTTLEQVCARCKYKYLVIAGRLADESSRQITRRDETPQGAAPISRAYELRIEQANDRLEVIHFELPGRSDSVMVRRGDKVAVVYTMRGQAREELVQVRNYATGAIYQLATPGVRSQFIAGCASVLIAIIAFLLALQSEVPGRVSIVVAVLALGASFYLITRAITPVHEMDAAQRASLEISQTLLQQKNDLVAKRLAIANDRKEKAELRARLLSLQRKMREVGLPTYEPRIELMRRAIATVDEQIAIEERLEDGYDKSIKILEIEYETGVVSKQLSEDVSSALQGKLHELASLEEQHEELSRVLSANAEVEKLLKGR